MTENAAHRIVSELVKAFKAVAMYPAGHPARARFYGRLRDDFSGYLNEFGTLQFTIQGQAILHQGEPVATRDGSDRFLAAECFVRQIHSLTFYRGISDQDIDLVFSLLTMDPAVLRTQGGAVEFLRGRGSGAFQVEQTDYEGILERREEVDPSAGGGYGSETRSPVQVPDQPRTVQAPTPKIFAQQDRAEVSQEDWLRAKLAELDQARSVGTYKAVLGEVFNSLRSTGLLNMPRYTVLVLRHLGKHLLAQTPEEVALIIRAAVRELATYDTLLEMAGALTARDDTDKHPVYAVLDQVQDLSIPALLQRLADEEEAHGRRVLITALGRYGQAIRGHLQKWLTDDRWFVVRNALGLLQQVGNAKDSVGVRTFLLHPHPKVRLEALRFLYRYPAPVEDALMDALLADVDPEVQARAIYALGVLQGEKGLDRLMHIARKPFLGEGDTVRRASAIKGVGRYGGGRAVEFLKTLVLKRSLIDAAGSARIQKACVEALIESQDGQAAAILRRALPRLKGPVFKQAEDYVKKYG